MLHIRPVEMSDHDFWYTLDKHLPETEFARKVRDETGYVLCEDGACVGILRYNLFWDNTPFLNLIYIRPSCQSRGLGRYFMNFWEQEMRAQGHCMALVSTQSDECAQHFYRKLGYQDCGCLCLNLACCAQPLEIFFFKML